MEGTNKRLSRDTNVHYNKSTLHTFMLLNDILEKTRLCFEVSIW